MNFGSLLAKLFERIPEWPIKNNIRYFLAFNKLVPSFISDISPIKGYELNYNLKEGDIVIDAGAFTGDYAVFAAKKVKERGKVIAFEPDSKNRRILIKNLNHEKIKNVTIIPKGLWSKNTTLILNQSQGLHSFLSGENKGDKTGSEKVKVVKLDDELRRLNIKRVDFIKMDIEGAEIEAIKGSEKILRQYKPRLAIASYHIVNNKTTSIFLEKYLTGLGYKVKSDFPKHLTTYAS